MRRLIESVLLLAFLCASIPSFSQEALPATPVHEVTENYFGTKITDPYRWLEDTSSPAVVSWMKAQNDYTRAVLKRIPGRDNWGSKNSNHLRRVR